jgi:hypothetical protein
VPCKLVVGLEEVCVVGGGGDEGGRVRGIVGFLIGGSFRERRDLGAR